MTERSPRVARIQYANPAQGAAVSNTPNIGEAPETGVVTSVTYAANAAVTGANTNSRSLVLLNRGQTGVGTTEVARLDLVAGVNLAADDETALTLSATTANRNVTAGDILEFQSNAVGTGLADPGGLLQVEISRSA